MKLKPLLFSFGVSGKNLIRYSDPEKTILDFIYIWRYNGVPKDRIIADVRDWSTNLSVSKFMEYAKNYPKTVQAIANEIAYKRRKDVCMRKDFVASCCKANRHRTSGPVREGFDTAPDINRPLAK